MNRLGNRHASDCELLDHKGMYFYSVFSESFRLCSCCVVHQNFLSASQKIYRKDGLTLSMTRCIWSLRGPVGNKFWWYLFLWKLSFYLQVIDFDIYSPNKSTTSKKVTCNSTYCHEQRCSSPSSDCLYSIRYLSANTSSSGVVVEDVLHLTTDGPKLKGVEAPIAFG